MRLPARLFLFCTIVLSVSVLNAAEAQRALSLVYSVAFSPDGNSVLAGGDDHLARLWDAASGKQVRQFAGHSGDVLSVAFSPDGRQVLTGARDATARLWDVATGKELRRLEGDEVAVNAVAFSPDGRQVLTGGWDNTVRLWDIASGRELRRFKGHGGDVLSVAFSQDGRFVLTGSWDETAILWDYATGKQVRKFEAHPENKDHYTSRHLPYQVTSAAISPDGRLVLLANLIELQLWDGTNGQFWNSARGKELWTTDGLFVTVAFSPDGRLMVSGGHDPGIAILWDVASRKELRRFDARTSSIKAVAFSPDGRTLLTGGDDGTARLWDVASGKELRRLEKHKAKGN